MSAAVGERLCVIIMYYCCVCFIMCVTSSFSVGFRLRIFIPKISQINKISKRGFCLSSFLCVSAFMTSVQKSVHLHWPREIRITTMSACIYFFICRLSFVKKCRNSADEWFIHVHGYKITAYQCALTYARLTSCMRPSSEPFILFNYILLL